MKKNIISIIAVDLFILSSLCAWGAGVVAIKEQPYHQDEGANVIAYVTLNGEGGPSIKIDVGNKVLTIDPKKMVGKVEVLSALPLNITNESEVGILRKSVIEYRDFSVRFPKSVPLLTRHIKSLNDYIKDFEGGKVRFRGEWMIREIMMTTIAKDEQARASIAVEHEKNQQEKMAFEESQKAKGLAKYNGKWISVEEMKNLVAGEEAARKLNLENSKYWFNWNKYSEANKIKRTKIPVWEAQLYQEGKKSEEIEAAILALKRELNLQQETLQWLSEKTKLMMASGSSDEDVNILVERVMQNKVAIGMDSETVVVSWGRPRKINTTINSMGKSEQWVYGGDIDSHYVYLADGVVTSISD